MRSVRRSIRATRSHSQQIDMSEKWVSLFQPIYLCGFPRKVSSRLDRFHRGWERLHWVASS